MIGYFLKPKSRLYIWFGIVTFNGDGLEYEKFSLRLADILDSKYIPWTTCQPFQPDKTERLCIRACYMNQNLAEEIIKLAKLDNNIILISGQVYTNGVDNKYCSTPYDLFRERDTKSPYRDDLIRAVITELSKGADAEFHGFDFEDVFYLYHSGCFDGCSGIGLERLERELIKVKDNCENLYRGKELKILY